MWRRTLVLLLGLLALAGCSSDPGPAPAATAPMAGVGAPSDAVHGATAGTAPLAFGATSTDPNGLAVTVTAPQVVALPAGVTPVQSWPTYVTVTVTLVNGRSDAYDPQSLFVSLTSGKDTAEQVFAAGAGLPGTPSQGLAPGARVSFPLAFGVTAATGLSLEIAPDFTQPTVLYQG
ncbi:hypothetical protein RHODO2019_06715 [Rhodococcus antarcticus]|uniref:DUF4352 domain-containing protein n=1 Tax=Rhodococcus antarcticus TaxID=2987751 RepID=A0ABY6P3K0_9NOCA|nr:hypothetical protein [Rhodococcus antarcticus]UZJ26103.1 hypothetical protein RHODO2019_06715 [Rhodococcus antarcticus]